ncbi:MAG: transposase, partial [Clostridia bacterium]|nr:transposase [Clostridia bacterium]
YHVILRGINHQQIFEEKEDYDKFLRILTDCQRISEFKLFAYCLMSNHIHLLIKEEKEPLRQLMKRISNRFVYWYNTKYQRDGHLFQDRFKSEPVEDDTYFATVVRYIHQNPLKAGLCTDISVYNFSSYNCFFNNTNLIDKDYVFGIIPFEQFERFNKENENYECLESSDKPSTRVTDEDARKIIYKVSKCKSASEFQRLDNAFKEKSVREIHKRGVSIRQISRLCGQSKGIVERVLSISRAYRT